MTDRHEHNPIPFRPPGGVRARLKAYAERTGQAVNKILTAAVTEFLDRHDEENPR